MAGIMRSWVDYVAAFDGEGHVLMDSMQLADWLALDTRDLTGRIGYTDGPFVAYLYLWQSALIVAKSAQVIGRDEDVARYEELAQRIRT